MARWMYRIALATCPVEFRGRFGVRMQTDFDQLIARAPSRRARWALVAREAIDVMRAGWSARVGRDPHRRRPARKPGWRERATLAFDDVRFAGRSLAARPGYAFISVVTLTLGIGAGTIVFSVVDNVVIKPLPYADADRLVYLYAADLSRGPDSRFPVTAGEFHDWRELAASFDQMVATRPRGAVLGGGSHLERVVLSEVSDGTFEMFGAEPIMGVGLAAGSGADEVVISHGAWQSVFGGDDGVIGRTVLLNDEAHTIVGVMPAGFRYPFATSASMWRPLRFTPEEAGDRARRSLTVLGKLAAGITVAQASAEMVAVSASTAETLGIADDNWGVNVLDLKGIYLQDSTTVYTILSAAVVLVLLIACANLASLVLARGAARQGEIAVRVALGAGRIRLVRLLLAEGALVTIAGTAGGILVAVWGLSAILPFAPSWPLPLRESSFTARGIGFAACAGVVSVVLFSLLPAVGVTHPNLGRALGGAARAAGGSLRAMRLRRALVVAQVGLAIVLMIGASLLVRSVANIVNADSGFDFRGVVSARVTTSLEDVAAEAYFNELLERAAGLPGVTDAAMVDAAPMDGSGDWMRIFVDGERVQEERALGADYRRISSSYFDTLRIERVAGRLLTDADAHGARVAVINEDFARRFLAGREPLGARFAVAPSMGMDATDRLEELTVVGVVRTVQEWGPSSFVIPIVYVPFAADPDTSMSLLLRTEVAPASLIGPLRAIVQQVGDSPVDRVRTLASYFQETFETQRFLLALLGTFAGLAVILAAVGLYGVIAYHVVQRRREIGVRVALGADGPSIVRMFVRQGVILAVMAVALGVVGGIPLARSLSEAQMGMLLVDVHWLDPVAFAAVPALVLATALLASWIPSRRAARVDPVEALRSDA